MAKALLVLVLVLEAGLGAALLISWWDPDRRVWPPPSRDSWSFWSVWGSILIVAAGIVVLGYQHGSPRARIVRPIGILGGVLMGGGLALAIAGVAQLGVRSSAGLEGALITDGIYRYTRNPQYLGDMLILFGWGLVAGSWPVWLTVGPGMLWFAATPFVEEPWLEDRFGEEYRKYRREVPRFI